MKLVGVGWKDVKGRGRGWGESFKYIERRWVKALIAQKNFYRRGALVLERALAQCKPSRTTSSARDAVRNSELDLRTSKLGLRRVLGTLDIGIDSQTNPQLKSPAFPVKHPSILSICHSSSWPQLPSPPPSWRRSLQSPRPLTESITMIPSD